MVSLQCAANDFLSIELVARGLLNPPFWDSSAFAWNLNEAAKGFPNHPWLSRVASGVIDDLTSKNQLSECARIRLWQIAFAASGVSCQKDAYSNKL